jgi:maltooligosyltrehalose trehalohydrolase
MRKTPAVNDKAKLGATIMEGSRCGFLLWAPLAGSVDVQIVLPQEKLLPLTRGDKGYFYGTFEGVRPGAQYFYRLDGRKRLPDPASRFQPHGVHGPSQVIESGFAWNDGSWSGLHLRDYVIYELHVGVYTPEGTFDAVTGHLDRLVELGITAIELMPAAQFPGNRNWGYDGVYPFAVQNTYGGPDGLKRLVNACHEKGLAVVLDAVYNHIGPEGNYLGDFGPYFTDRYRTPWGMALNFDGPDSDEVRRYFTENALYWVKECHIDALRLDAVHAIMDKSPHPFLAELAEAVHGEAARLKRPVHLMAEDDLNDAALIRPPRLGGYGLDTHWNDDFHHALHTMLTGEQTGYYIDFGRFDQLAKAFREGFVYSGEYSAYRRRRQGSSSRGVEPHHLVVFAQNHDQTGNRVLGDRLSRLVSFEMLKLAAGAVILSPFIPLLFMGEEYGETAPFLYFVSHSDPDLIEAVQKGRKEEFADFRWIGEPSDPQAEETFQRSKLQHGLRLKGEHEVLFRFYRELLRLRSQFRASNKKMDVLSYESEHVLLLRLGGETPDVITLLHFGRMERSFIFQWPPGEWVKKLDSTENRWGGKGSGIPPIVYGREEVSLGLAPYSLLLFVARKER